MSIQLYDKMNQYLANQMLYYIKLHNLHWYVTGASFFSLHEKLESLYDETATIMDEVAERLLALEQHPIASATIALRVSSIKERESFDISSKDTAKELSSDTEAWIRDTKDIIVLADKVGDGVTADQFNGYLATYEKLSWMLRAYLS